MAADLAKIERAVGTNRQAVWIIDLGLRAQAPVARKAGRPGARDGPHRLRRDHRNAKDRQAG